MVKRFTDKDGDLQRMFESVKSKVQGPLKLARSGKHIVVSSANASFRIAIPRGGEEEAEQTARQIEELEKAANPEGRGAPT